MQILRPIVTLGHFPIFKQPNFPHPECIGPSIYRSYTLLLCVCPGPSPFQHTTTPMPSQQCHLLVWYMFHYQSITSGWQRPFVDWSHARQQRQDILVTQPIGGHRLDTLLVFSNVIFDDPIVIFGLQKQNQNSVTVLEQPLVLVSLNPTSRLHVCWNLLLHSREPHNPQMCYHFVFVVRILVLFSFIWTQIRLLTKQFTTWTVRKDYRL